MLESVLAKAIERIEARQLRNEAQVKQSVIVPVLRGLGWDDADPAEFVPEYSFPHSATGRVDYALLGADGKPVMFIEAKKLGAADDTAEEQLFKYAYGQGVPLLILTDGEIWNFYLSMASGVAAERRFYRAVLTAAGKTAEYARRFERYIGKTAVCSGAAVGAAEKQHTSNQAKEKANRAIPKVWESLLETPDQALRDVLAAAVENACGTQPEIDDLDSFLAEQSRPTAQPAPRPRPAAGKPPPMVAGRQAKEKTGAHFPGSNKSARKKIVGYVFNDQAHQVGAGNHTLAAILKEFQRRQSGFMALFAEQTAVGHRRRLVAPDRADLYDAEYLSKYAVDLENGWWFGTNINAQSVRKYCQIACRIAGVDFGSQLTLIER